MLVSQAGFAQAPDQPTKEKAGAESGAESLRVLERKVEDAFLRGDTTLLRSVLREDFIFSHGTGAVEGKAETLANFAKPGNFLSRSLTSVEVEEHGDVALTTGRIEVRSSTSREYTICYLRLYDRSEGDWKLVAHRTLRYAEGFAETCDTK